MMSPNLFYQAFLLCIGVASLIFGLFLLFFKAPSQQYLPTLPTFKESFGGRLSCHEPQHYVLGHHFR